MRRLLPAPAVLAMLALALTPPAMAQSGGADAGAPGSGAGTTAGGGGAGYQPGARQKPTKRKAARKRRAPARPSGPVLVSFELSRARLYLHGAPASVSFRIDGRSRLKDVRIYLIPAGARAPAATIKLGPRPRGPVVRAALTDRETGALGKARTSLGWPPRMRVAFGCAAGRASARRASSCSRITASRWLEPSPSVALAHASAPRDRAIAIRARTSRPQRAPRSWRPARAP